MSLKQKTCPYILMSLKQKNMFLCSYVFKTCPYVFKTKKHVLMFLCL